MRTALGTVYVGPDNSDVPVFNPEDSTIDVVLESCFGPELMPEKRVVLDEPLNPRTVGAQPSAVFVTPGGFLRLVLTMTTVAGKSTFTSREMTFEEARAAYQRCQHLKT